VLTECVAHPSNVMTALAPRCTFQSCLNALCALQVLTKRVAFLVSELGVSAHDILAITFTRKGAAEMKARLQRELTPADADGVRVATFHSVALSTLRRWIKCLPGTALNERFTVASEQDHQSHISVSISDLSDFGKHMSDPKRRKCALSEEKEQWKHEARAWAVLHEIEQSSYVRGRGGKKVSPHASLKKAMLLVRPTPLPASHPVFTADPLIPLPPFSPLCSLLPFRLSAHHAATLYAAATSMSNCRSRSCRRQLQALTCYGHRLTLRLA
jgi:hypothetical protein